MYKLSYDDKTISYTTADEVIHALFNLHTYYESINPILVLVHWDSLLSLQLGISGPYDSCVLLTIPKDSLEDTKIAYNNDSNASGENNINFESPNFPFTSREYNLIPFNIFIEEVRYILVHHTPSDKLKWYSH